MQHCIIFLVLLLISISASSTAMTISKVAVIGGTGKLGRLTVQKLVNQGIECKILARNLPSSNNNDAEVVVKDLKDATTREEVVAYLASQPGVSFVQGDVSNVDALTELCKDCQACIAVYGSTRKSKLSDIWSNPEDTDKTHAKQVNYQGVINLIEACKASKSCQRIVRITGKGEDPTGIFSVLINMLGSMAKAWNYEGERALRGQSDIDYTIIRPGIMSEEGQEEGSSLSLGDDGADLPVAKISYGDIADLCVECLDYDNASRSTLTAMTTPPEEGKSPITSWKPMLETVKADRRKFPEDMLQQHYDAVKGALFKLGAFSAICLAVLLKFLISLF